MLVPLNASLSIRFLCEAPKLVQVSVSVACSCSCVFQCGVCCRLSQTAFVWRQMVEVAPPASSPPQMLPWAPCDSVSQRLPGQSGRLLQDRLRQTYLISEHQSQPFFDEQGLPLLERHPLNDRDQWDTRRRFKELVAERRIPSHTGRSTDQRRSADPGRSIGRSADQPIGPSADQPISRSARHARHARAHFGSGLACTCPCPRARAQVVRRGWWVAGLMR